MSAINKEELKTIFVSSCIESAVRALNCRTSENVFAHETHQSDRKLYLGILRCASYTKQGIYDGGCTENTGYMEEKSRNSTLIKERKDKLMLNVYHGSTVRITTPIAKAGREHLDFGQGFYIIDIKEQAERWTFHLAKQLHAVDIAH